MQRIGALLLLVALALLGAAPAFAQPTWFYVRADAGGSFSRDLGGAIDDDIGTAALVGGGFGFKILPFIRTDLTVAYRTGYEIDTSNGIAGQGAGVRLHGDVTSLTGMLNAYYDFPEFGRFQPYIGGGIGVAYNQVDTVSGGGVTLRGEDTTEFAWQAGLGVAISILPGIALDVGYHYVDLGTLKTRESGSSAATSSDLSAHEVTAGLRIGF